MKINGLLYNYTVAQYKPHINKCNESKISNELNREFNREIIGHSIGPNKDASLVYRAFSSIRTNLKSITMFHTDRGNEFKNKVSDEVLDTFKIKRSLSMKGCPYDNAVAVATFKIFKTEFTQNYHFNNLDELDFMLSDYINWFNNIRIHSTLGYLSPREYKLRNLKKLSNSVLEIQVQVTLLKLKPL